MKIFMLTLAATSCLLSGCTDMRGRTATSPDTTASAGPYGPYYGNSSPGPGSATAK